MRVFRIWPNFEIASMPVDLKQMPNGIRPTAEDLAKKFDFETEIKKGSNGHILVGKNRLTGQKVVVKFYYWGDGAHLEPKHLFDLESPYTLSVLDAAAIDSDDAYFVTEYCENGDLDDYLDKGNIGIRQAVEVTIEVASGVNHIHSKGFIHRDLKPSNIFCNKNKMFVIGDFGSLVESNDQGYADTGSKHSLLYRTPEEAGSCRAYPQGDIYQIGIILYQLLGGRLFYNETEWLSAKELAVYCAKGEPDNQLYANCIIEKKIIGGKLLDYSSLPAWVPAELVRVIRKCCKLDRSLRFGSVSELIVHLSNLRSSLPDWRLEPDAVLYKRKCRFRLTDSDGKYFVEKKASEHAAWRRQRKYPSMTLNAAVKLVESL